MTQIVTLVLAIVGTVTGVLSLAWQTYTWKKSGPDVKVTATNTFPVFGDNLGEHHLTVTAANTGRAPITVTVWGIEMPGHGSIITRVPIPWSTPLPHRLEPHSSADFHMEAHEVRTAAHKYGVRYEETCTRTFFSATAAGWPPTACPSATSAVALGLQPTSGTAA